ncbi:ABC transporter ATP-binding protein [Roseateles sp. DAIF2]|uniref:ABC transporter ATP-binding protein n=1 Tax=Roseateles sp. DAIF2 TaxID=2714952 RepID=UPI0018A2577E|nr:ABC transporter ATP-binding protein [Roseateles sp. DAIF2]QPF72606.1 ABC transporter ATP-binding protein [Roseateles sp. DAIF2]
MSAVTLHRIEKDFGPQAPVIKGVDLQIEAGEFVVFVGPSGSGKSTLLRIIAGLASASAGELRIGERRANELPAAQRGIAMVFQSYALYPHMSVAENMGFALRMAGVPRAEVRVRVARSAEVLQIAHLLERKPRTLSGGQRQRVAIGRAIVREPQVFLFDEPLSNLDAALRQDMRVELARLHQQLGATMIYVTHDQVEAMTLASRIVVFDGGVVQQVGSPAELYEHPANLFVAGFLGAPRMNLLPGRLLAADAALAQVEVEGLGRIAVAVDARRSALGSAVTLGLRPEHLRLASADAPPADAAPTAGRLDLVEYLGDHLLAYVSQPGLPQRLCAKLSRQDLPPCATGAALRLQLPARHALLFDAQGLAHPRSASH